MPEPRDGTAGYRGAVADSHHLLLSLAGLIDDELLGWSRELIAVGETDYVWDLLSATVAAEQVRLPQPVADALRAARPGLASPAPPSEPAATVRHRFVADPAAAGYPATIAAGFPFETLHMLPGRLLRGCWLWLSWRITPAGCAPTPVPHPVVLVETTDGAGAELLAYQIAELLEQAGVFASVEVFGPNTPLGNYHRAALESAVPVGDIASRGDLAPPTTAPVCRAEPSRTDPPPLPSSAPAAPQASPTRSALGPVERVNTARAAPLPMRGHEVNDPFTIRAELPTRTPTRAVREPLHDTRPPRAQGRPPQDPDRHDRPRDGSLGPPQSARRQPTATFAPPERETATPNSSPNSPQRTQPRSVGH